MVSILFWLITIKILDILDLLQCMNTENFNILKIFRVLIRKPIFLYLASAPVQLGLLLSHSKGFRPKCIIF